MTFFKKTCLRLMCTVGVLLSVSITAGDTIHIVVPKKLQDDAGVKLAANDLRNALKTTSSRNAKVVFRAEGKALPAGDLVLVGASDEAALDAWNPKTPEGFRIRPVAMQDRKAIAVQGKPAGLMHGAFELARRVRLGQNPWKTSIESAPAFPLRMFSEEGQLLDIPDFGYYSEEAPYVDEKRLRAEVDELKRLIDEIAALGYNAFTVLHLSFEEYVDYRYLDKPVYAPGDPHLARTPVFCKYLKELAEYAHARHLQFYLQLYETQFPERLDKLYKVSLDSPNMTKIIDAKCRELFERVPLDGLVITTTETHPRCGYHSKTLWKGKGLAGAGRVAGMYHAACASHGKKAVFRAWRVASTAEQFKTLSDNLPDEAMLAIKNTGGDYYLSFPTTDVITSGLAKKQPLMVLFDTYREFDGWSRLFCHMKRWEQIIRTCRDSGVEALNAWGPWATGCNLPDWRPGYLLDMDGQAPKVKVSWAGLWNDWRMFTRGFTPGQSNVYLLSRLAWDPDADAKTITRDFAALHLGAENADAAAESLLASEDAWAEEYVDGVHPCYLKWTMVFHPRRLDWMEIAYAKNPLDKVVASNARALKHADLMEKAFARTDPAKAPDPHRYEKFKEGIEKTVLYLRTFYLWRQCWWRDRAMKDLRGEDKAANAKSLADDLDRLMPLFDQWERWPDEARHWRISFRKGTDTITPDGIRPSWYPQGHYTMESTARKWAGKSGVRK